MNKENYEELTNDELRKLLGRRNLSKSGIKVELLARLEEDDKKIDEGVEPDEEDSPDSEEDEEKNNEEDDEDEEEEEEEPEDEEPKLKVKKLKPLKKINPASDSIPDVMRLIDSKFIKVDKPSPGGDAENMLRHLAGQRKVRTIVPLETKEQRGTAFETVILNGFRLNILKGFFVDVPEQIANVIQDAYHATQEALEEMIVTNPITGEQSFAAIHKKDLQAQRDLNV